MHDLALERLYEPAPVDETREIVRRRLPLHQVVQLRVLERNRRLRREPLRRSLGFRVEPAFGRVQEERRLAVVVARELEHDARVAAVDVAHPADLLVSLTDTSAPRTRRLDHHLEDHGQKRTRVVRRRERVPHERERLTGVRAHTVAPFATVVVSAPPDRSGRSAHGADEEPDGDDRRSRGE